MVFLVDGQSLRLITGVNPVIFSCKILRNIYQSFNVHKDILGISRDCTTKEALQLLKTTARQLEDMPAQAKEFFDVKGQCQGPQGTLSQKSVKSISHLVEGLCKLKGTSNEFDPKLKNVISMKSLTTLSNDYINGVLRDFNPTPTVLDVSCYFVNPCKDTLYTLVWAGFPGSLHLRT